MRYRFALFLFITFVSKTLLFVHATDLKIENAAISFKHVNLLKGHKDIVQVLKILKNGLIVSGSADTVMRVWSMDGVCLKYLGNHADWINAVEELSDGRVACGSNWGIIKLWNIDKETCTSLQNLEKEDCYGSAAIQLNNGNIAFGAAKREIKIWDIEKDVCVKTIDTDPDKAWISSLIEIKDYKSDYLASASWNSFVKIWDISSDSGKCVKTLAGHTDCVNVVVQVDSEILASGADDSTIMLWDIDSGENIATLRGHTDRVYALTLADGKIISGSRDKTVKIWDPETQSCLATIQCEDKIYSLAYSSDKKYLFAGLGRGNIEVFQLDFDSAKSL